MTEKGNVYYLWLFYESITIYKDKNNYHYEAKLTRPKSESSIREIPIPKKLKSELKNLNILVKEEKLKLGPAYNENNLLFPSSTGTYLDINNLFFKSPSSESGLK